MRCHLQLPLALLLLLVELMLHHQSCRPHAAMLPMHMQQLQGVQLQMLQVLQLPRLLWHLQSRCAQPAASPLQQPLRQLPLLRLLLLGRHWGRQGQGPSALLMQRGQWLWLLYSKPCTGSST